MDGKQKNSIRNGLFAILIIYLLIIRVIYAFSYEIDLQGIEFYFLHHCQLLFQHKPLYTDPVQFPFLINFYPPLFENIYFALFKFFHIDPVKDLHASFVLGRIFSLLQLGMCLFLLFRIIKLFTRSGEINTVLILFFLLLLPEHFYTLRPDSIKLTFFLAYLYFTFSGVFKNKPAYCMLGVCCAVIAVYLKHDVLIHILTVYAISIYFLRKRSLIWGLMSFSFLTVIFFILFSYVYGPAFRKSIFMYNFQYSGSMWINMMFISFNLFRTFPLLLFTLLNLRSEYVRVKMIAGLSLAIYILSSLLLFRTGSNLHYTMESTLLLLLNVAVYAYSKRFFNSWGMNAFVVMLLFFNHFIVYKQFITPGQWKSEKASYEEMHKESILIKNITGNEVVFFPNAKHVIFNASLPVIYGYDFHFDRFSDLYLPVTIKPKFIFTDFRAYDDCFKNGTVKYIVIENQKKAILQLKRYYSNYIYYKSAGNMLLYKYQRMGN